MEEVRCERATKRHRDTDIEKKHPDTKGERVGGARSRKTGADISRHYYTTILHYVLHTTDAMYKTDP